MFTFNMSVTYGSTMHKKDTPEALGGVDFTK